MGPIVVIKGGLGNQLFQWTFAHTLPLGKHFYPSRFHYGHHDKIMHLELEDIFESCPHVLNKGAYSALRELLSHSAEWMWSKRYLQGATESLLGYYQEDPRHDVPQVAKIPRRARIISGYFQKNEYVDSSNGAVESEILPYTKRIADKLMGNMIIPRRYSVLHVRTGVYSDRSSSDLSFIGQLSEEYFLENLDKLKASYLVVLTENANHIPGMLKKIQPDLVLDSSKLDAWETLAAMAVSDSMIGANSTLSWWGAKLAAINGGETWLPSNWSAWNNIDSFDYRFPTVQTLEPTWRV